MIKHLDRSAALYVHQSSAQQRMAPVPASRLRTNAAWRLLHARGALRDFSRISTAARVFADR